MGLPSSLAWVNANDTVHGYLTVDNGVGSGTPHYANDVQTPYGTRLGAPWAGTVIAPPGNEGFPYTPWGGQVFVKMSNGSVYYLYHLDQVFVKIGQMVAQGDVLGISGGQTSGGTHPTSPAYSNGPHTHIGFFTKFVKANGGQTSMPFGPDITPAFNALRAGSLLQPSGGKGATSGNILQNARTVLTGGDTPFTLAANADVNALLWAMDDVLELKNPFDGVSTGGNLFDAVSTTVQVGENLIDDFGAGVIRLLFLIAGMFVLFKVTSAFIDYGAIGSSVAQSSKAIAELGAFLA